METNGSMKWNSFLGWVAERQNQDVTNGHTRLHVNSSHTVNHLGQKRLQIAEHHVWCSWCIWGCEDSMLKKRKKNIYAELFDEFWRRRRQPWYFVGLRAEENTGPCRREARQVECTGTPVWGKMWKLLQISLKVLKVDISRRSAANLKRAHYIRERIKSVLKHNKRGLLSEKAARNENGPLGSKRSRLISALNAIILPI